MLGKLLLAIVCVIGGGCAILAIVGILSSTSERTPKLSVGDCFVLSYHDKTQESWEAPARIHKVVAIGEKNYQTGLWYPGTKSWYVANSFLDSVSFDTKVVKVDCPQ